jgi:hypothetical protein
MIVSNGIEITSKRKGNSRPSGTTLRLTCALPTMQRAQTATRRSLGTQIRNPRGASTISVAPPCCRSIIPSAMASPRPVPPQALPKVISNALRYGQQARVWAQSENELVEIVVDDNGPGIPLAAREAVFSAFHRAESSRNRPTGRRRVAEARRYRIEDERAKAARVRAFYVTIRTSHCAI